MYSAGRPAMSADSECPCPDMRWQVPQAIFAVPLSSFTIRGAGPCSLGNQSGGFPLLATCAGSYTLVLPGTLTGPVALTLGGCTLSGMLYAHEGSPFGTDCGICAAAVKDNSKAKGRILIQLLIVLGPNQFER